MAPWAPSEADAISDKLKLLDGMHIEWSQLFIAGVARKVWKHLKLPGEFNAYRHAELVTWYVEPKHDSVVVQSDAVKDYIKRVAKAAS